MNEKIKDEKNLSRNDSFKNNNKNKVVSIIMNIVGWIISIFNILVAYAIFNTIKYGNIPSFVLAILAAIISNPLLYIITKLNKKKRNVWVGYIIAILIGVISFFLLYKALWSFKLDRKIEYDNVSFRISNEWDVVIGNDEKTPSYSIYPYNKDHSVLIYFQIIEKGSSVKEDFVNSFTSELKSTGATIDNVTYSKLNSYDCIIINWRNKGERVTYMFPVNDKVYCISYGEIMDISNGFRLQMEEILKTLQIKDITLELSDEKIEKGKESEIKVKFNPPSFSEKYTLKSSDETMAIIKDNKIQALKNGKVTISVESESGLKYSKEIEIYTKVDEVTLDKDELIMHVGDTVTLNVNILPKDASDNKAIWNSTSSEVASVDTYGNIVAKSLGTTKIKVNVGYKTTECNVNVVDWTEEEYKKQCKKYSFEELARNPSLMNGKFVKVTGEVVQVIKGYGNNISLRVNITKWGSYSTYYKDTVYINYVLPSNGEHILEDDIITIYGKASGEKSYTSAFGALITIPEIDAKYIERN